MSASFPLLRLMPVACALVFAGCSSLSGPATPSAHGGAEADAGIPADPSVLARQREGAEREAVEYQTHVAQMRIAGNFCADQQRLMEYAYKYLKREALPMPPAALTLDQARCASRTFLKGVIPSAGRIIGYKTDLMPAPDDDTSPGKPRSVAVRGALLERMLLPSGVVLATDRYAIHPRMEADMVVVVRSAAIHDAQTPREVLASLSGIYPFIELPDLAYQHPDQMTAADATVVNANARFGVLGTEIPVRVDQDMVDQLGTMTVKITDQNGQVVQSAPGTALQGNPLNAVLMLVQDLEKDGIRMRPGDMLSLGAFGARIKPEAGKSYRMTYEGLPGTPSAVVNFR